MKQTLTELMQKTTDRRFATESLFIGLRVAIVLIVLIAGLSSSSSSTFVLLSWLAACMVTGLMFIIANYKLVNKWACLLIAVADALCVIKAFSLLGPLESYLIYSYLTVVAFSSLRLGLAGGVAMALFTSAYDYCYIEQVAGQPYLYGPVVLRVGLVWLGAILIGSTINLVSSNRKQIQRLNDELDNKVTVLISASRVLGSINDLRKLSSYFQETVGRIFGITEHILVMLDQGIRQPLVISNVGVTTTMLFEHLLKIKKESLTAGTLLRPLKLSVGAVQQGSQGLFVLLVKDSETKELFDEQDIFQTTFSQFILAIDNALLLEKVRESSLTDHLTGLYNQRYFYERINEEIKRAQREQHDMSLLIIDVDDFKAHNDLYGHLNGDKALAKIAHAIRISCRETDVAARYGGEEFVVILPNTGLEEAAVVAGKIIENVRRESYPDNNGPVEPGLTVSIGAASYPSQGTSIVEIIEHADSAMYEVKSSGKDGVTIAKKRLVAQNKKQTRERRA
ncbi:MAG TPA: GGDEF domain-containing protein [Candidatus Aquicultor sp.]|jgi:diguanylate cyclase (GGDEF)-like protein